MFTNNWFEITAKANFEKYVSGIKKETGTLEFLEIGCYEGQASVWMLQKTEARVCVIDTFKGSREHDAKFEGTMLSRFRENIDPYRNRVDILEGTSQDRLKKMSYGFFDFIYVDGSHEAKDVLEDAVLAFPLLRHGGIMIFDDYTWRGSNNRYEIPAMGIDAFLFVYADQLTILEKNSQVIIEKK